MELKSVRQSRNLTQEQLAELTGLPQTTISDMERGVIKKPSWDAVSKICQVLGHEPRDLFPVDDAPNAVAS